MESLSAFGCGQYQLKDGGIRCTIKERLAGSRCLLRRDRRKNVPERKKVQPTRQAFARNDVGVTILLYNINNETKGDPCHLNFRGRSFEIIRGGYTYMVTFYPCLISGNTVVLPRGTWLSIRAHTCPN
jgi:hypothetical protein